MKNISRIRTKSDALPFVLYFNIINTVISENMSVHSNNNTDVKRRNNCL